MNLLTTQKSTNEWITLKVLLLVWTCSPTPPRFIFFFPLHFCSFPFTHVASNLGSPHYLSFLPSLSPNILFSPACFNLALFPPPSLPDLDVKASQAVGFCREAVRAREPAYWDPWMGQIDRNSVPTKNIVLGEREGERKGPVIEVQANHAAGGEADLKSPDSPYKCRIKDIYWTTRLVLKKNLFALYANADTPKSLIVLIARGYLRYCYSSRINTFQQLYEPSLMQTHKQHASVLRPTCLSGKSLWSLAVLSARSGTIILPIKCTTRPHPPFTMDPSSFTLF